MFICTIIFGTAINEQKTECVDRGITVVVVVHISQDMNDLVNE